MAGITVSGDPGFSPSEVRDASSSARVTASIFASGRGIATASSALLRPGLLRRPCDAHEEGGRRHVEATRGHARLSHPPRSAHRARSDWPLVRELAEILKNAWNDALLPELLAQDLESATRAHLSEEGYLRPRVDVTLDNSRSGVQRAVVQVTPGARTATRRLPSRGTRRFPRAHCRRLRVGGRWQRRSGTIPLRWSRKSSPNMPREVTWRRRLQWATSSRAIARRCLSSSRRGRSPASRRSRSQVCRPCASKAHRPRSVSRSAHRLRRAPSVRHVSDSSATTATGLSRCARRRDDPRGGAGRTCRSELHRDRRTAARRPRRSRRRRAEHERLAGRSRGHDHIRRGCRTVRSGRDRTTFTASEPSAPPQCDSSPCRPCLPKGRWRSTQWSRCRKPAGISCDTASRCPQRGGARRRPALCRRRRGSSRPQFPWPRHRPGAWHARRAESGECPWSVFDAAPGIAAASTNVSLTLRTENQTSSAGTCTLTMRPISRSNSAGGLVAGWSWRGDTAPRVVPSFELRAASPADQLRRPLCVD